jgi:N-acetylglucosaminyldiphosphoundecaprenol N-acetyl-beta-D-mannosaminyltransferase
MKRLKNGLLVMNSPFNARLSAAHQSPTPSPAPRPVPPLAPEPRHTVSVLGAPIDAVGMDEALRRITGWAARGESRSVCICNVHSVVTAAQESRFMRVLQNADLATPDGAPVAWLMRRQGVVGQARVSGPDLMLAYCERAASRGEPLFLFGSTDVTLAILQARLSERFPGLRIAGSLAPPFRAATAEEDAAHVAAINASGARTVWVSLGCPKQERWMAEHRGQVKAVMVGVGAAFDFHAGLQARAPLWMRRAGLEWLHRLAGDPRRLWKRYLFTNSVFIWRVAQQVWAGRSAGQEVGR